MVVLKQVNRLGKKNPENGTAVKRKQSRRSANHVIVKMKKENGSKNQKESEGKWHILAIVELKWEKKIQRELM
jgi:hypothetical protein